MDLSKLKIAITEIKTEIEEAIQTASFAGTSYLNGQKAKEALIRSSRLILKIHEVTKHSLVNELLLKKQHFTIFPPLNTSSPELSITGFIKPKKQDIVILFDRDKPTPEKIKEGPLSGEVDSIGKAISERSIVIGVRSQLSSVAKNFDTLMERAFAETLNLRLRLPKLVMGEIYLLPVLEYDDRAMESNKIRWKKKPVPVEKFIRTFLGISGRREETYVAENYKYERSVLLLVDLKKSPPTVYTSLQELKDDGYVSKNFEGNYDLLSPIGFAKEIIESYKKRHSVK